MLMKLMEQKNKRIFGVIAYSLTRFDFEDMGVYLVVHMIGGL